MKAGILLAAFGAGNIQGEAALRLFETRVRASFPGVAVRWAFTSDLMRRRLARVRKKADSVEKALNKMAFEKFTHVAVQPLHVIPGLEYAELVSAASLLRTREAFSSLVVGEPLLCDAPESVERAAAALLAALPPERNPNEAVLFMGHGSRHEGESCYEALAAVVGSYDPLVFIGTLNGTVRLETLFPRLPSPGAPESVRLWLMPLLGVVGRHTLEDMAGNGEHSWLSRLGKAGFASIPVLRGLVEYRSFADLWIAHLAGAMSAWE